MRTLPFVSSAPRAATLPALHASFRRTLRAEDKSERTVKSYTEAVSLLADFLQRRGHPLTVTAITRNDVRAFIADQLQRWKPATALNRYRSLQAFFKWCTAEGELDASPMVGMKPPQLPNQPPPVLTDDQLRRLLKATGGRREDDPRNGPFVGVSSHGPTPPACIPRAIRKRTAVEARPAESRRHSALTGRPSTVKLGLRRTSVRVPRGNGCRASGRRGAGGSRPFCGSRTAPVRSAGWRALRRPSRPRGAPAR
jgi:integrase